MLKASLDLLLRCRFDELWQGCKKAQLPDIFNKEGGGKDKACKQNLLVRLDETQLVKLCLLALIPLDLSYAKGYFKEADISLEGAKNEELFFYLLTATLCGESDIINKYSSKITSPKLALFLNICIQARAKNYDNSLKYYAKSGKKIKPLAKSLALFIALQGMPKIIQKRFLKVMDDKNLWLNRLALGEQITQDAPYFVRVNACISCFDNDEAKAFKEAISLVRLGFSNQILLPFMLDYALANARFKEILSLEKAIRKICSTPYMQGVFAMYCAIYFFLCNKRETALKILRANLGFLDYKEDKFNKNHQVFFALIYNFSKFLQRTSYERFVHSSQSQPSKPLITVGASASLIVANNYLKFLCEEKKVLTCFVMGLKIFHFGFDNKYLRAIKRHFVFINKLKFDYDLFFAIGNIDLRPDDGIWKNSYKKGLLWQEVMKKTIDSYVAKISCLSCNCPGKVFVQGVQAPRFELSGEYDPGDKKAYLSFVKEYNEYLCKIVTKYGFHFIDIYSPTVLASGEGGGPFYLDDHHVDITVYEHLGEKYLQKS